MAVTKIWKVMNRTDKVIDYAINKKKTSKKKDTNDLNEVLLYAINGEKTEKKYFVTGINCDEDNAYQEMENIKIFFNNNDKILAYHCYQSFAEGEVSPQIAHEIGVKLAQEMWGERFQVIITTHLNTNHIHNHFVVNSVSFVDGKKYYSNRTNTAIFRNLSDELCEEYGLSVLKNKAYKINFENYYKKYIQNDSYSTIAKRDLDFAIKQSYSYKDFYKLMKKLDYEVYERSGKISIKKYPYKRNIRIERRFGENYSIEHIKYRILNENVVRVPFIEDYFGSKKKINYLKKPKRIKKISGFLAIYYKYMFMLKLYHKNPYIKLSPQMRADILKMDKFSSEAKILATNKILNKKDLDNHLMKLRKKINEELGKRDILWQRRKAKKNIDKRVELCNQISEQTEKISRLRKEAELCEDINSRIPKMKEEFYNQDKNQQTKELEKNKNRKEKF